MSPDLDLDLDLRPEQDLTRHWPETEAWQFQMTSSNKTDLHNWELGAADPLFILIFILMYILNIWNPNM